MCDERKFSLSSPRLTKFIVRGIFMSADLC